MTREAVLAFTLLVAGIVILTILIDRWGNGPRA